MLTEEDDKLPGFCPNTLEGEVRAKESHDLLTEWKINPPLAIPQALLSHKKIIKVGQPVEIKMIAGQNKI